MTLMASQKQISSKNSGCTEVCTCDVKSRMNSNMTIQTEVALQNIRPVPDLGPHMKMARIEKIRFRVICAE